MVLPVAASLFILTGFSQGILESMPLKGMIGDPHALSVLPGDLGTSASCEKLHNIGGVRPLSRSPSQPF